MASCLFVAILLSNEPAEFQTSRVHFSARLRQKGHNVCELFVDEHGIKAPTYHRDPRQPNGQPPFERVYIDGHGTLGTKLISDMKVSRLMRIIQRAFDPVSYNSPTFILIVCDGGMVGSPIPRLVLRHAKIPSAKVIGYAGAIAIRFAAPRPPMILGERIFDPDPDAQTEANAKKPREFKNIKWEYSYAGGVYGTDIIRKPARPKKLPPPLPPPLPPEVLLPYLQFYAKTALSGFSGESGYFEIPSQG